jgi:DNA-binding CsgD family transcriptional regulator
MDRSGVRPIVARDRERLRGIVDGIERFSDAPVLDMVARELPLLLDAEIGCGYRVGLQEETWHIDFVHASGVTPAFVPELERYAARAPASRFSGYDALRPPRAQRNRPVAATELLGAEQFASLPFTEHFLKPLGLERHDHVRLLVCDGSLLLSWVGVLTTRPHGPREKRLLGALAKPLAARLRLEQQLREAEVNARGFEVALEAIDTAAFVVRGDHSVVHANAIGRALLDEPGSFDLTARLRAARLGLDRYLSITPIATRGLEHYALVVLGTPQPDLDVRLRRATREWSLTPRQAEIVRRVALGDGNKAIAERLRCSVATVEVHVGAVLKKARVGGRTELVAKFWTKV